MKKYLPIILVFGITFFIYYLVATNFTGRPKWALDYFNPLAASIRQGHLDLPAPGSQYDLSYFEGKWFLPMGILTSLILIPFQIIMDRFIPLVYFSLFFGSLNVLIIYLLVRRLRKEFFPEMREWEIYAFSALFAFGTMNFYLSTLGSYWHVNQVVSSFWSFLGIYIVFKRKRTVLDYVLSVWLISLTLIGRTTLIFLVSVPLFLYLFDTFQLKNQKYRIDRMLKSVFIFGPPLIIFSLVFFALNFFRFGNIFEYGYNYIREAPYLSAIRLKNGITSITNLWQNLWYMVFEMPKLILLPKPKLEINLNGNSIFYLTPPLLSIFWARIITRKNKRIIIDPYIAALVLGIVLTIIPSLLYYSNGWMQFGYRYALDIMPLLILLSIFGIKGKITAFYLVGIIFAIFIQYLGIQALM